MRDDGVFLAGVAIAGSEATITVRGDVDLAARPELRSLVDACVERGVTSFVFDMRGVTLCGSECVAVVVYASGRVDGAVRVRPSARVLQTLEMFDLARLFVIDP